MLIRKSKSSEKQREKARQLDMELSHSRIEILYKLKRLATSVEKQFTAVPIWRNVLMWIAVSSTIGISIIITLLVNRHYNQLPPEVPILYDSYNESWDSYPRVFLFTVPLVLLVFGLLSIRMLQKVYYMNKKLTLMICALITISYIFEYIAVSEILNISTT